MMRPGVDLTQAFGFDRRQLDAVLGDLAEERAELAQRHGGVLAALWYGRELLRSAPHLVAEALRRGTPATRSRLISLLAAPVFITTFTAVLLSDGPPARLAIPGGRSEIVINSTHSARLDVRAYDARGHALDTGQVRYRWLSGSPLGISAAGVLSCAHRANAVVRASAGDVFTDVTVACRPVSDLRSVSKIDLIAGEGPHDLAFAAIGVDGDTVMQLRGSLTIDDSSVATIEGATVTPRAASAATIHVVVGDHETRIRVIVHKPVDSFVGPQATGAYLAHHVQLAQGDTTDWKLPRGSMWVKYIPDHPGDAPPTINLNGGVNCMLSEFGGPVITVDEYATRCEVYNSDGRLTVGHGHIGAKVVSGWLAIERLGRFK